MSNTCPTWSVTDTGTTVTSLIIFWSVLVPCPICVEDRETDTAVTFSVVRLYLGVSVSHRIHVQHEEIATTFLIVLVRVHFGVSVSCVTECKTYKTTILFRSFLFKLWKCQCSVLYMSGRMRHGNGMEFLIVYVYIWSVTSQVWRDTSGETIFWIPSVYIWNVTAGSSTCATELVAEAISWIVGVYFEVCTGWYIGDMITYFWIVTRFWYMSEMA